MGCLGKHPTGQAENGSGDDHGTQAPGRDLGHQSHDVVGVMHAPHQTHLFGHDGSHHARQERVVPQATNCQHFQSEDGARQRGAKHRGKTGTDAGHQNNAAIFMLELEQAGQLVCQSAAHLHGGAFAPYRGAEQV